jgi:hypothetical protein
MLHILLGLLALIFAFDGTGGSGGDAKDDGGDGSDSGDEGSDDDDDADDDDEKLGAGGKKALTDERKARKAADRRTKKAEAAAAKLQKQLDTASDASDSDQEKAIKDAAKSARSEAATAYGARILESEILAAAGGKLVTPADAVGLLDLTEFDADADPEELRASIGDAIDQLLKDRPYLRAEKVSGSADGGAKPKPAKTDDKLSPKERIIRGYEQNKKQ